MKIGKCMSKDVKVIDPGESIRAAARLMARIDAGSLPVGEGDRLVGMITDRDIAVRAVGEGKGPDTPVREVMTHELKYCFEDQDTEEVIRNMGQLKVRRLPVLSRDKRLVGIVALGDLAAHGDENDAVGEALGDISKPGGLHSQTGARRTRETEEASPV
ncbi:MAG TPA: CBS domain-containing protein [Solimonas sp.]|nr:CBS domain-containing protein [Solimonas sp.]